MVSGLPWSRAWADTAYGPEGFWRRSSPADHFATSATAGPELASALGTLLAAHPGVDTVVDVGAGDGALLAALAAQQPSLTLVGVDLRPRPPGLDERVGWVEDCWDVVGGWTGGAAVELLAGLHAPALLTATEWLDDLPCPVAEPAPDGHRELTADEPAGPSLAGPPLSAADQAWVDRWWPAGPQVEVGRPRDDAWAALVMALGGVGGLVLAIDYGHERGDRPVGGSLAGYRAGRPVPPRPDRRANLTAAVAVDALAEAGERAGARTLWSRRQHDVLAELLPPLEDPDPVTELAARSRRAALGERRDWGSHWWLLQQVPARPR